MQGQPGQSLMPQPGPDAQLSPSRPRANPTPVWLKSSHWEAGLQGPWPACFPPCLRRFTREADYMCIPVEAGASVHR